MSTKIEVKKTYEDLYTPSGEFRLGMAPTPVRNSRSNFGKARKLQGIDGFARVFTYAVLFAGVLAFAVSVWYLVDRESYNDFVDESNQAIIDFRDTFVDR
jgi:hypothetical protein